VVETHSDLFLLAVQTLVANEELDSNLVKLHWFSRRATGETDVASADVDEAGTFGNWPEDFAEVQLETKDAFLSAAEPKMRLFDDVA
jgi:predicted ATPase